MVAFKRPISISNFSAL